MFHLNINLTSAQSVFHNQKMCIYAAMFLGADVFEGVFRN